MILNEEEQRGGKIWFFGAGFFAICLSLFLWQADEYLTHSDGEQIRHDILLELRSAQSSLGSGASDYRQHDAASFQKESELAAE